MRVNRAPLRPPASVGVRTSVFAVGRRVYIAGPPGGPARVTLTDDPGTTVVASVGDGTEVAILAWRPSWAGTTRYKVRVADTGIEGWLEVGNLRSTAIAGLPVSSTPPATSPPPFRASEPGHSARRFGARRD